MLANLIGGFIVILIGVNLIGPLANNIDDVIDKTYANGTTMEGLNVTGASASILDLVTIFFALGIMSAGVAITVTGLKNAGIM